MATPMTAPVSPSAWRLVPVEPTEAMLEAFYEATEVLATGTIRGFLDGWEAMLAASPAPSIEGLREKVAELVIMFDWENELYSNLIDDLLALLAREGV